MAETLLVIVRLQVVLVPVQAPCHCWKVKPDAGVAVRVTWVPGANAALQVVPQLMPEGELVTAPFPPTVTDNTGSTTKFAVTVALLSRVTLHGPDPVQAPDQPVNVDPEAGVAEREIAVPEENIPEQVGPQSIPAGLLETVPLPLPEG